jgi:hypothetical protein
VIATATFKYRGKWYREGDAVPLMASSEERSHRLGGLIADDLVAAETEEALRSPAKRRRRKR